MSAAVKLLKEYKLKDFVDNVHLAKEAIFSLQFHKNLNFLTIVVEMFAKKMPLLELTDDVKKLTTGK